MVLKFTGYIKMMYRLSEKMLITFRVHDMNRRISE